MVKRVLLLAAFLAGCSGSPGPDASLDSAALPPPPETTDRNVESPFCTLAPAPAVGVRELARTPIGSRTLDIELESQAQQSAQHIAVTLPRNADLSGATRYPVLYLLHGALDGHRAYFDHGIEDLLGDLPLIVVSPYSGPGNGYNDWYGTLTGSGEQPNAWETHHLREVLPFVEQHFPVRTDRGGRAIAGISMGGNGTMYYAAAHPELFAAAGSLSGAVNLTRDYPWYPVVQYATNASSVIPGFGPVGYCTYGDFVLQQGVWRDHDPTYLAGNLRGVDLWLSCGGGEPDAIPYANNSPDPVEFEVCEMTENFIEALDAAGIPHTDELYDAGRHDWSYWTVELSHLLPWMAERLGHDAPAPASFDFRSIKPRFSAWGWEFFAWRDVREFVYLESVSAGGLTVTGSGALDVITAPLFAPGKRYRVSDDIIEADANGRLAFRLDLGPSHTQQQFQFEPSALAGWTRREVEIIPE